MSQARRLTGPKKYLAVVLAILFILLIWQVAAWSLPAFLMPGIPTVVERLITTIQQAEFREGLYGSMSRLGSGYGFALLFGAFGDERHRERAASACLGRTGDGCFALAAAAPRLPAGGDARADHWCPAGLR